MLLKEFLFGVLPLRFCLYFILCPPPFVPAKCSSRVFCQSLPYNLKNKEYIRGGRFFLHLLIERAFASQGAPVRCVFPQFFVLYPKGCGTPRLISPQVSFFAKIHLGLSGAPSPHKSLSLYRLGWGAIRGGAPLNPIYRGERHSIPIMGMSATPLSPRPKVVPSPLDTKPPTSCPPAPNLLPPSPPAPKKKKPSPPAPKKKISSPQTPQNRA